MQDELEDIQRTSHQLTQLCGAQIFLHLSGVEISGGNWIVSVSGLTNDIVIKTLFIISSVLAIKYLISLMARSSRKLFINKRIKSPKRQPVDITYPPENGKTLPPTEYESIKVKMSVLEIIRVTGFLYLFPLILWGYSLYLYICH